MPPSSTPQFDQALEKHYRDITPHTRRCTETGAAFEITLQDIERYRNLRVPLPTTTPSVRLRRLRAAVAGLDLFKRTQPDGSMMISMYDPESPVSVLPVETWWNADQFDAMVYGQTYRPGVSFFDQWTELSHRVPGFSMEIPSKTATSPIKGCAMKIANTRISVWA